MALAFGLGGIAYIAISDLVDKLRAASDSKGASSFSGVWMVYIAVLIDLASDGLMIGTGSAVSLLMALALSAGQVLADIPEGYTTIAYFFLKGQSEVLQMSALAFVAGLLAFAAVEDMLTEAHESTEDSKGALLLFTGGFVLFVLVSAGIGGS